MLREVWRKVAEYVVADDLDGALGYVLSIMKSYDATDYHQVDDLEFSNSTHSIVSPSLE